MNRSLLPSAFSASCHTASQPASQAHPLDRTDGRSDALSLRPQPLTVIQRTAGLKTLHMKVLEKPAKHKMSALTLQFVDKNGS